MDDQNTFERQLAIGLDRLAGPPRPVDAMAVARSVTTQSSTWGSNMFSALKFVAAAAILALFGGFLLTGIPTTQQGDEMAPAAVTESPSPVTTEELLSGMVTQEVEPGVYRVNTDGVRDLTQQNSEVPRDAIVAVIVAGPDGSVWLGSTGRWLRLGREDPQTIMGGRPSEFEVAPDGTLWGVTGASAHSFDGKSWTKWGSDWADLNGLTVAPDGTVWTTGGEAWGETTGLYRLTADGLTATPDWTDVHPRAAGPSHVVAAPDGAVWLIGETAPDLPGYDNGGPRVDAFLRFDGSDWEAVTVPDDLRYVEGQSFDIGADGTLWAAVGNPSLEGDGLARLDDSGWTVFTEADGVRPWGIYGFIPTDHLHAAPDGSVWLNAEGDGSSCGGVANYDGTTWTGYLSDLCVHDMDIAPDGAVWVQAGTLRVSGGFEEWDKPDTYVIASRAVAAAEEAEVTEPLPADEPTDTREASTTTEELLSGMVTEEVEPGVLLVVNDGVRDIAVPGGMWGTAGLSIDQDGDIWVHGEKTAYRLGEPAEPGWTPGRSVVDITSDGTLWGTTPESTIASFDGESWTERATLDETAWVIGMATTPDGTTWATTVDSSQCPENTSAPSCRRIQLVRIDEAGASTAPGWEGAEPGQLQWHKPLVSPDGDVWLVEAEDPEMEGCSVGAFRRYDGTEWHIIDVPEGLTIGPAGESFGFGPNGTLWAASGRLGGGSGCMDANRGLARLDESGWSLFTQEEGVRPWGGEGAYGPSDHLRVAPDGGVWVAGAGWADCYGVARFDGASWTPYLEGYCVDGLEITPEGTIWALASATNEGPLGLYLITREAVAATE